MAYRRFNARRSNRRPEPRTITVKYAGKCACCGAKIRAGETATYFPAGYRDLLTGIIEHVSCTRDRPDNDYAGDGLDQRWEDDFAARCGL